MNHQHIDSMTAEELEDTKILVVINLAHPDSKWADIAQMISELSEYTRARIVWLVKVHTIQGTHQELIVTNIVKIQELLNYNEESVVI